MQHSNTNHQREKNSMQEANYMPSVEWLLPQGNRKWAVLMEKKSPENSLSYLNCFKIKK